MADNTAYFFINKNDKEVLQVDVRTMASMILKDYLPELQLTNCMTLCKNASKIPMEQIDDPLVYQAIDKAVEVIRKEQSPYVEQAAELKAEIQTIENKMAAIRNENDILRGKRWPLESELQSLSFFQGARKREIREQLLNLQDKKVPDELIEKLPIMKKELEDIEKKIDELGDYVKSAIWTQDEITRKGTVVRASSLVEKTPSVINEKNENNNVAAKVDEILSKLI